MFSFYTVDMQGHLLHFGWTSVDVNASGAPMVYLPLLDCNTF